MSLTLEIFNKKISIPWPLSPERKRRTSAFRRNCIPKDVLLTSKESSELLLGIRALLLILWARLFYILGYFYFSFGEKYISPVGLPYDPFPGIEGTKKRELSSVWMSSSLFSSFSYINYYSCLLWVSEIPLYYAVILWIMYSPEDSGIQLSCVHPSCPA